MSDSSLSADRLNPLRLQLAARGIDYWLQPVNDEFQGEYVPAYAERLGWLSGFYASAGVGIIAADGSERSGLLVDGRYILQAQAEVDSTSWHVVNSGEMGIAAWLAAHAKKGAVIGCDQWLHTHAQCEQLTQLLALKGMTFTPITENLVDAVWDNQPKPPVEPIEIYPEVLAGQSAREKIQSVTRMLNEQALCGLVITQPDAIAWLLNIRGRDIPFNPLLLVYAVLMRSGEIVLLTHPRGREDEVAQYLAQQRVRMMTFDEWFTHADIRSDVGLAPQDNLGIDPASAAHGWWVWAKEKGITLSVMRDPIERLKAVKSTAEQEGMREAHRKDGVALTHFLSQIAQQSDASFTELQIVEQLEQARSADNSYRGASFATIAGSGANGAIVHYRANEATNRIWQQGEFLLLDSGGQYPEGTTDITRVIPRGDVSDVMRDRYTRVLKGHIALAQAVFPRGTSGRQLDALARQYLWQVGCDYDHGTGHGVGTFLCVHEGPQRISKKGSDAVLEVGMVISNEPGYYEAGAYGIRIENLVMVVESPIANMLAFETITLVPIAAAPIVMDLLSDSDITWLNAYHARVFDTIAPRLRNETARMWLKQATQPLMHPKR